MKKVFLISSLLLLIGCEPKMEIQQTPIGRLQNHCDNMIKYGYPQNQVENRRVAFVCHDNYALGYDTKFGSPLWVAEHLTSNNINQQGEVRKDRHRKNPKFDIKNFPHPTEEDIESVKQNYVLYPLSNPKHYLNDQNAMSQTYYYSNNIPVTIANKELFVNLNKVTDSLIERYKEIYVYTGSLFLGSQPYLERFGEGNRNRLSIPPYIYRVILIPALNKTMVFVLPNTPNREKNPYRFLSSLDKLEMSIGFDFFPYAKENKRELLKRFSN